MNRVKEPASDLVTYSDREGLLLIRKYAVREACFLSCVPGEHLQAYYDATFSLLDAQLAKPHEEEDALETVAANVLLITANVSDWRDDKKHPAGAAVPMVNKKLSPAKTMKLLKDYWENKGKAFLVDDVAEGFNDLVNRVAGLFGASPAAPDPAKAALQRDLKVLKQVFEDVQRKITAQ
ncbi:MAG: hypothetical protein IKP40_10805 [Clostridia bacterium]|nr:hypothetical protein [Clostridia bacterium]